MIIFGMNNCYRFANERYLLGDIWNNRDVIILKIIVQNLIKYVHLLGKSRKVMPFHGKVYFFLLLRLLLHLVLALLRVPLSACLLALRVRKQSAN